MLANPHCAALLVVPTFISHPRTVQVDGAWRYTGGETYNDSVPESTDYCALVHQLADRKLRTVRTH